MLTIRNLVERGESFYNPYLNEIVKDLEAQGLAVESEGATAVFLDGVSFISLFSITMCLSTSLHKFCSLVHQQRR